MSDAGPSSTIGARDNVARGIAITIVTIIVFGAQDAMVKVLVQDYSSFQIVMMRYWAFAAFSIWLVARQAPLRQALRSHNPRLQMLRGLMLIADIWLFAKAVGMVPLAELQAINLVYPLMVTLFAIPLLGEKVGVFRFVAVGIGFCGALVIVRPGGLPLDWGVFYGLAASAFYALYIVLTRKVAQHDTTATNMIYVGLIGLVLSSAVGVFHWQPMDFNAMLLMGAVMITSCLGHGLMMVALSMAPASVVQPFNYLTLPWAITLSYLVFGHLIDGVSLIGAGVIVGAGLVVMARERIKGRAKPSGAPGLPGKE